MRKVVLHRDEDHYIVAKCPSLPGNISQGQTRSEALDNIKEAITLYLQSLLQHGEPILADQVKLICSISMQNICFNHEYLCG